MGSSSAVSTANVLTYRVPGKNSARDAIVGSSKALGDVLNQVEQVAETEATVLIQGETGTGKELIAEALHQASRRQSRRMIKLNCAALPASLIESELFGREKGAYTGASSKQLGRFELADGSTLFLDEIGELPLELQSRLLRVLQQGEFERLGSSQTLSVDVRVVAATNRDLAQAVRDGQFREDLYYRLNVFPIDIPPLRRRREDIVELVLAFVDEFNEKMAKDVQTVPQAQLEALERYDWPGNIRQLRNVVERAMILCKGAVLHVDLPAMELPASAAPLTLDEVQRRHIIEVLNGTGWKVSGKNGAAEILGLKPTTLESRMSKLGIRRGG